MNSRLCSWSRLYPAVGQTRTRARTRTSLQRTHMLSTEGHMMGHTLQNRRETRVSFITRSPQTQTYPNFIQTPQKLSFQTLMGIRRDARKQMPGLPSYLSQEIITILPPLQFKRAPHYLVFWQEKQLVEQTEYNTLCTVARNLLCAALSHQLLILNQVGAVNRGKVSQNSTFSCFFSFFLQKT